METRFEQKIREHRKNMIDNVRQHNIQCTGTEKLDIACLQEVRETTHFNAFFVSVNWIL